MRINTVRKESKIVLLSLVRSFEVAKYISEDSYALVFGINWFFALLTQSLLTLVVVNTLLLDIRQQVNANASKLDISVFSNNAENYSHFSFSSMATTFWF